MKPALAVALSTDNASANISASISTPESESQQTHDQISVSQQQQDAATAAVHGTMATSTIPSPALSIVTVQSQAKALAPTFTASATQSNTQAVVLGSTCAGDPSNRPRAHSHNSRHVSPAAVVTKPTLVISSGAVTGAPVAGLTTEGVPLERVKSAGAISQPAAGAGTTGEKKKSRFTVKSTLKEVLFYVIYFLSSNHVL